MQDFQPIPGLTGRIFTGSDAATHRLRNYPSSSSSASSTQQQQQQQQQLQSLIKCPRCDSTNTKFCYYNNYNLSQPRHFCKSCRRYWTKGGVLRNVPVGGGCRKNSKRSSKSSKPDKDRRKPATVPSGSSSESSSTLTASNPNPDPDPNPNPNPEPNPDPILEQSVFHNTAGSFTSLMTGTAEGFNFSDPGLLPPGFRVADPEPAVEQKAEQAMDPNPILNLRGFQEQGKGGGLNGLDWGAGGSVDSGSLFDITSSVDPAVYWNQSHWGDTDPSLYLP